MTDWLRWEMEAAYRDAMGAGGWLALVGPDLEEVPNTRVPWTGPHGYSWTGLAVTVYALLRVLEDGRKVGLSLDTWQRVLTPADTFQVEFPTFGPDPRLN